MIRFDPLIEEFEEAIEENIQKYRDAGGSPQNVIAWFADYFEHMIEAQPEKLREEIKRLVHNRICEGIDADTFQ